MEHQDVFAVYTWLHRRIESEIGLIGDNDMVGAFRLLEKITALENLHHCATSFRILLEDTDDAGCADLIQKHFRIFMTTVYIDYLIEVIDASENWNADSAGMRDLQKTVAEKLVPIREFYQGQFYE